MNLLLLITSWKDFLTQYLGEENAGNEILVNAFNYISIALWVILGIVGAIGAIYAIYLGIQLARAEDQSKRDDAKKHLITVFIAIGVTVLLIIIFNVALPAILGAFVKGNGYEKPVAIIKPILSLLKA